MRNRKQKRRTLCDTSSNARGLTPTILCELDLNVSAVRESMPIVSLSEVDERAKIKPPEGFPIFTLSGFHCFSLRKRAGDAW